MYSLPLTYPCKAFTFDLLLLYHLQLLSRWGASVDEVDHSGSTPGFYHYHHQHYPSCLKKKGKGS